jgi:hypothetical protein
VQQASRTKKIGLEGASVAAVGLRYRPHPCNPKLGECFLFVHGRIFEINAAAADFS